MRYQLELDIVVERERIIALFLDSNNLEKWQTSLVSFELISGTENREVGSQSRQVHKMGGRELEIIETITVHDYPDEFSATYESADVWNLIENRFIDAGAGKTKWILVSDFRSTNLFMKFLSFFFPGMFKKQTLTFMNKFKDFVEGTRA
ncbi:MAG: hypothetical protein ACR2OV_06430 [Hyphomicrobiaceae bacterium]